MSEYPATLGDLADVEARLDAAVTRLETRFSALFESQEMELSNLVLKAASEKAWADRAAKAILDLENRVKELEGLWTVARENPELVRELALQALKGKDP